MTWPREIISPAAYRETPTEPLGIFLFVNNLQSLQREKNIRNERDAAAAWENARVSFCNRKNEIMHFLCDAVMGKVTSGMMN